jgi:hypothetical protein
MWKWDTVAAVALSLVGLGVMAGQSFKVTGWTWVFWVPAILLLLVRFLHREPHVAGGAPSRKNQKLAEELSRLRSYGLHSIRNEFEANPNDLPTYLEREVRWRSEIESLMRRYRCSQVEIDEFNDTTHSEIGRAAAGATYGPEGNWLVGLMEVRLARLSMLIRKYADD